MRFNENQSLFPTRKIDSSHPLLPLSLPSTNPHKQSMMFDVPSKFSFHTSTPSCELFLPNVATFFSLFFFTFNFCVIEVEDHLSRITLSFPLYHRLSIAIRQLSFNSMYALMQDFPRSGKRHDARGVKQNHLLGGDWVKQIHLLLPKNHPGKFLQDHRIHAQLCSNASSRQGE